MKICRATNNIKQFESKSVYDILYTEEGLHKKNKSN